MRIHLENQSQFRNDDIRALFRAAMNATGKASTHPVSVSLRVFDTRGAKFAARAESEWLESYWAVKIPSPLKFADPERWFADAARLFWQISLRERGVKFCDMTEDQQNWGGALPGWAEGMQLRELKVEAPPEPTAADVYLAEKRHAEDMHRRATSRLKIAEDELRRAETRLKRARTSEAKWAEKLTKLASSDGRRQIEEARVAVIEELGEVFP